MTTTELFLSRTIDLPRSIVWAAFIDADLLDGWMQNAVSSARDDSRFAVTIQGPAGDGLGAFELVEVEGGPRLRSTDLTLHASVTVEPAFSALAREHWEQSLDLLENVLRGHPFDWTNHAAADADPGAESALHRIPGMPRA